MTDDFCACENCCYVDSVDFAYKNLVSVDYPAISYNGTYTVLADGGTHDIDGITYDGTPYKYVIRYLNSKDTTWSYNLRFFAVDSDNAINCDEIKLYYGSEDGSTVFHKYDLTLNEETDTSYCKIVMQYDLSRDELADNSRVYIAMNDFVDELSSFRIMPDSNDAIYPADDIEDFQFYLNKTALTAVVDDGAYYIDIDLSVMDINQAAQEAECEELGALMATAYLAGDAENCTLAQLTGSEWTDIPDYATMTTYRFMLPQADFEKCAKSVISDGTTVTFTSTLHLPVRNTGNTCYYFQPGFEKQTISISLAAEIDETDTTIYTTFGSELTTLEIERCTPISDYVIPQAIVKLIVRTTSTYEDVEVNEESYPKIGDLTLYGGWDADIATPVATKNCSTSETTDDAGNSVTVCDHWFHTRVCSKLYTTYDNECAFERTDLESITNLNFYEYMDATFHYTHRTARIDTDLSSTEFSATMCVSPEDDSIVNVEDEYPSSLKILNYNIEDLEDGESDMLSLNWTTADDTVNRFDRPLLLRMAVGEESGVSFSSLELFIKNVVVTLREPTGSNEILTEMSFNVAEKISFMQTSWSLFYSDPVYCAYYDSSNVDERCTEFFTDTRVNALNDDEAELDSARIDNICQRDSYALTNDTKNSDYFRFDPRIWFADLYDRASLRVEISVTAVIQSCGAAESRRLREITKTTSYLRTNPSAAAGSSRELASSDSVMYVSNDVVVIFGSSTNTTVTTVSSANFDTMAFIAQYPGVFVGIIVVVTAIILGVLACCYRQRIAGACGRCCRSDEDARDAEKGVHMPLATEESRIGGTGASRSKKKSSHARSSSSGARSGKVSSRMFDM